MKGIAEEHQPCLDVSMSDEATRREQSLQFVAKLKGDPLEKRCARATLWCSGDLPPASGEILCEPSLDQVTRGLFEPDNSASLETLASTALYLSLEVPHLLPIRITEIHPDCEDPHFHFEVTGPATKLRLPEA
ncbi:hypothetical protein [Prosthecobacter sp.]|uniref:hypothetical protein n=1 Tax=Prosthecobacter sp. TaxID=1965333 RepID=UPI0037843910